MASAFHPVKSARMETCLVREFRYENRIFLAPDSAVAGPEDVDMVVIPPAVEAGG